jgi:4-phytase/acid phosphatase
MVLSSLVCPLAFAAAPQVQDLRLERVLLLFRHGVRSPLAGEAATASLTRDAWPQWSTPESHLTPHGREGMRLLGAYDRLLFSAQGLLPASGCPPVGSVLIWTNSVERTVASGEALAQGLAPGCSLPVGHRAMDEPDPLFNPFDAGATDFNAEDAVRKITHEIGDPSALTAPHQAELHTMERVLGCQHSQSHCDIAAAPAILRPSADRRSMDLLGPVYLASGTAQVFALEYLEGLPLQQVAWGRASREDLTQMSRLHALLFDVYARPSYMARRLASVMARRVAEDLSTPTGPTITMLVGHDNNIAALAALLDIHFQIESYGRDDPPVGGALRFELLRDAHSGERFVRLFYQAQSLDQLRYLVPLSVKSPPVTLPIDLKGCSEGVGQICRLDAFTTFMQARLLHRW